MNYSGLDSAGGALVGVALTNYATGKLDFLKELVNKLPANTFWLIGINAAGGVATMHFVGKAPVNGQTIIMAGGVAFAYHALVGILDTSLQNTLNGN